MYKALDSASSLKYGCLQIQYIYPRSMNKLLPDGQFWENGLDFSIWERNYFRSKTNVPKWNTENEICKHNSRKFLFLHEITEFVYPFQLGGA